MAESVVPIRCRPHTHFAAVVHDPPARYSVNANGGLGRLRHRASPKHRSRSVRTTGGTQFVRRGFRPTPECWPLPHRSRSPPERKDRQRRAARSTRTLSRPRSHTWKYQKIPGSENGKEILVTFVITRFQAASPDKSPQVPSIFFQPGGR